MRAMPLVFAVVSAFVAAVPSAAGPADDPVRHLRPRDPTAALLLRFGSEKSARFREIVRRLEQSQIIVYIDVRRDSEHPVSGGLNFVGEAHGIRWVRAIVDSGTPSFLETCKDIVRLTSILGHELQHAIEASEAASMRDVGEFERHFRAIGVDEGPRVLDTIAARQTGKWVAAELRGLIRPRTDVTMAATKADSEAAKAPGDGGS